MAGCNKSVVNLPICCGRTQGRFPAQAYGDELCSTAASLSLILPGAITNGAVSPYFFLKKKVMTFLVIVLKTDSQTSLLPPPFFSLFLRLFGRKKIRLSLGCHPLDGVTRGGPPVTMNKESQYAFCYVL